MRLQTKKKWYWACGRARELLQKYKTQVLTKKKKKPHRSNEEALFFLQHKDVCLK